MLGFVASPHVPRAHVQGITRKRIGCHFTECRAFFPQFHFLGQLPVHAARPVQLYIRTPLACRARADRAWAVSSPSVALASAHVTCDVPYIPTGRARIQLYMRRSKRTPAGSCCPPLTEYLLVGFGASKILTCDFRPPSGRMVVVEFAPQAKHAVGNATVHVEVAQCV